MLRVATASLSGVNGVAYRNGRRHDAQWQLRTFIKHLRSYQRALMSRHVVRILFCL